MSASFEVPEEVLCQMAQELYAELNYGENVHLKPALVDALRVVLARFPEAAPEPCKHEARYTSVDGSLRCSECGCVLPPEGERVLDKMAQLAEGYHDALKIDGVSEYTKAATGARHASCFD